VAASYTPKGTNRTIQVLGAGSVLDVQVISAATVPHGVYFEYPVPYSAWLGNTEDQLIAPIAEAIESRLGNDFIAGAVFTQTVDVNQLLADAIEFTVQLPGNPAFTTTVEVPVSLLAGTDTFQGQIVAQMFQDALAHLAATAAL
jgi:hypothetical protein